MKKLSILFLGCMFLLACGPEIHFSEYKTIDGAEWHKDSIVTIQPQLEQGLGMVALKVNVRHTGLYPYSNLFLFVNTTLPNGTSRQDTVECTLADKKGMWYGSGLGDIFDFKQEIGRIQAPEAGTYKFTIQQGMRTGVLEEVMDIGVSVTEVEN